MGDYESEHNIADSRTAADYGAAPYRGAPHVVGATPGGCPRTGPVPGPYGASPTALAIPNTTGDCSIWGAGNWTPSNTGRECVQLVPWRDTQYQNACCAPNSTNSAPQCAPSWCFGSPACDNQDGAAAYCGGTGFNVYPGSDAVDGPGAMTTPGAEKLPNTQASIYELQRRCLADPGCGGFTTAEGDGGATLWSWWKGSGGPRPANPGTTYYQKGPRAVVADPKCTGAVLRNPAQVWANNAAAAFCTAGDNITTPFCRQFVNAAKAAGIEPAWANQAAADYCRRNPAERNFCACINTAVPSPVCLDGNCTSKLGGAAYTSLGQDRQSVACGSPTICQQLFDFQGINCPRDPSLKSCINISNNAFSQTCGGAQPPCKSNANCPAGQICKGGKCVPGCAADPECGPGKACIGSVCVTAAPTPTPAPAPTPTPAPTPAPTPTPAPPQSPSTTKQKIALLFIFFLASILVLSKNYRNYSMKSKSALSSGVSTSSSAGTPRT